MKTTTPKIVSRRDKVVDTMAKKFANTTTVEARIIANRKRRRQKPVYIYIVIGVAVVTTLLSTLINTGVITPPQLTDQAASAPARRTVIDHLLQEFADKKINADQYALYLKDYLVNYKSFPEEYKSDSIYSVSSSVIIKALYDIWPQVSLRTRAILLKKMPFIEDRWRKAGLTVNLKGY